MICLFSFSLCGCNMMARKFGGTSNIELEQGKKLIMITFKDNDLWILTRNRYANEKPECYEFQEDSNIGILEGTVNICEK